jgi:hypothetical protein
MPDAWNKEGSMTTENRYRSFISLFVTLLSICVIGGFSVAATPGTGILNISSTPTGAKLIVNGKERGVTPQILELPVGAHKILLTLEGCENLESNINIVADKVTRLQLKMKPLKKAAPSLTMHVKPMVPTEAIVRVHTAEENQKPGTILLATTPPGLTAYIDQHQVPQVTPVSFDIRPGIYELTLRSQSGEILYRKTIFVRPEERLELDIVVRKQRSIDYSDPWR